MFGEGHEDSIVRRGIDEALACQEMLERTPVPPSFLAQLVARVIPLGKSRPRRDPPPERRVIPTVPNGTVTR